MPIDAQKTVLKPFPNGLRRMSAREVTDAYGLNMVLFGVPGTGKTTLAATAQDSEYGANVLFIDVEGGTRSIADRVDVDVVRPDTVGDVKNVYDWLVSEPNHGYKTIVIDTLSELQRVGMKEILATSKTPDQPGWPEWGKSTEQMMRMVRAFRNLSQTKGWNVIFTAHATEQKDAVTGSILIRPNLTPKATEMVCGAVDVIGYLTREPNGTRRLRMEPNNQIVAKYRQPLTGNRLPTMIDNPSLVTMLEHLRGDAVFSPSTLDRDITAMNAAVTVSVE